MKIYSIPLALYFLVSISSVSSQGQTSCVGRCGQGYTRADPCHCDYTCMSYMECCQDFKTVCTSDGSCKGRCHEGFIRGQTCDCDPGCGKFGKCCPDYEESCAQPTQNARPPSSSPDQPSRDEAEKPPEPTTKPKDQVPEDAPEDPNQKPKDKKRPPKKSPKKPKKKKKVVESEEEIEESEENMSSSSFSSTSSSSSVKGSKTTKKHSRKNQKKNKDDPDNPDEDNGDPTTKDGKPKKPKRPGDEPEDPDAPPKEPNPKGKKKPKNPSSLETEENVEERTDVNSANTDENTSTSNQRTKKRSPSSQKKKPRKPGDDTDDPLGKGKKKINSKKTKKKKGKPTDGDNDPLKPGKGKKQKKKPKKKVDSEEERQETVESEFSSSSSSSSSHTSSKSSSRRLSGKNKKKKNPEPEDPLAPPKRKKDKDSPPTPEPTFKVEGSGDDGSGMDFLSTTRSATTLMVHSTTTASQTTKEINQTEATVQPTKSPTENPAVTTEKEKTTTVNIPTTKEGTEKTTNAMTTSTQSPTTEERTTGKSTSTEPPPQQTTTQKSEQAQTTVITESTTTHSDHTIPSESNIKGTSIEPQQTLTTKQSVILTTSQPGDESEVSTITSKAENEPTPTKESDNMKMTTKSVNPTKTPKPRGSPTNRPLNPEEMENFKPTNPSTTNPYHICDLLKEEAIKLSISDDDLQRVNEICTEMQQLYPLVSTPSPDVKQPDTGDRDIPSSYPYEITPNGNQPPGTRIIQIVDEIYRRMNNSPMANLTGVHSYTIHRPSIWVLLRNKIRSSNDPQKNLCNGQPVDGITTLQNGSMVAFRGHYFWTLNKGGVMGCPRKITEVWGVPSPIDTVFTRCNCGGKTFFFKGSRYWRFSNDMMDQGYPKEIIKGFGGLRGKVNAVLPVAGFRTRPESVYFFKPGGFVQKYTFRQQQAKRCTKKKRPSVQYPINSKNIETVKYRFPRDVVRHRIQIHRSFANVQQPLGMLHEQTTVRLTWRGIPNNIISAVSLPNYKKKDGFDYYVFNKDKYYNINMSSKTAVKPQPGSEQNISKDWYNCKE
ncbi:proteoglycan 4 [Ranitomeya variabilis]|uniref:proteoglycan 4 n=1 Tax=Ranitomeya variabilis TaxID=490064 RepID=UPI0040578199